jgi:hypothetical protein
VLAAGGGKGLRMRRSDRLADGCGWLGPRRAMWTMHQPKWRWVWVCVWGVAAVRLHTHMNTCCAVFRGGGGECSARRASSLVGLKSRESGQERRGPIFALLQRSGVAGPCLQSHVCGLRSGSNYLQL